MREESGVQCEKLSLLQLFLQQHVRNLTHQMVCYSKQFVKSYLAGCWTDRLSVTLTEASLEKTETTLVRVQKTSFVLVVTITDGDGTTSSFGRQKYFWKFPQVPSKISSGVTWTVVSPLAACERYNMSTLDVSAGLQKH